MRRHGTDSTGSAYGPVADTSKSGNKHTVSPFKLPYSQNVCCYMESDLNLLEQETVNTDNYEIRCDCGRWMALPQGSGTSGVEILGFATVVLRNYKTKKVRSQS